LGGSRDGSAGRAIAVDASGSAYITGSTSSSDFPTSPDAFQTTFGKAFSGATDAFVSKLNAAGSALVYSTYLGATDTGGFGIAVDAKGNAFVAGFTNSANFPTTPGAFQTTYGGLGDAFVTKLNAAGSGLLYSTYLGGGGDDLATAIGVDAAGNSFVTGHTSSTDFPTTRGAFQTICGGCNAATNSGDAWMRADEAYFIRLLQAQLDQSRLSAATTPSPSIQGELSSTAFFNLIENSYTFRDSLKQKMAPRLGTEMAIINEFKEIASEKLKDFSAIPNSL
jgi:hypothetical protein